MIIDIFGLLLISSMVLSAISNGTIDSTILFALLSYNRAQTSEVARQNVFLGYNAHI
jgi:hypothetical protein